MESKINIAELLKDCPKGMELYSPIYGFGNLTKVTDRIHVKFPKEHNVKCFRLDGKVSENGEVMIFPKGKTTWEGFVPPCKFKDGDIIFTDTNALKCDLENSWVSIFKEYRNNRCACYVCLCLSDLELYHDKWEDELLCELCEIEENRLATEEEKEKLFDAIKANGYRWNAETKTLEELIVPKFKVGDVIQDIDSYMVKIAEVNIEDECYVYESMIAKGIGSIMFNAQDEWGLVLNKFDITTLKPYDKVLYRMHDKDTWCNSFYSFYKSPHHFVTSLTIARQCIPYEGNEHLLGTTNDCDEYYKTW